MPADATLALLRDGYAFISRRCDRQGSDVVETRLLGERTICMRGREAAELLYDPDRFTRQGAFPSRVVRTLLGRGGVQALDGAAHRHRKAMLRSLMSPAAVAALSDVLVARWRARLPDWEAADEIVLFEEVGQLLCAAGCEWAGVPLAASEVPRRTAELHALIDAPAAVGPRHWRGLVARRRGERWTADLVDEVRRGRLRPPEDRALHVIAWHRDLDGRLLDRRVAAVELLNVLRPTVAVDRFVVFTALALHRQPRWHEAVRADDDAAQRFVEEVRRTSPFFPMVGARVRSAFEWRGTQFPVGRRVLLDLYGTNLHPRVWHEPERFAPERFVHRHVGPYDLVPQGGGYHDKGHRCAGEELTAALMTAALRMLTEQMRYAVGEQDLSVSLRRIPALPRSGMRLRDVRRVPAPAG